MTDETLNFIQQWYSSHCDGEWEHGFGMRIETLDNPGWRIRINLVGTELAGRTYDLRYVKRSENDWLRCWIEQDIFNIGCGPNNLIEGLKVFQDWVTKNSKTGQAAEIDVPPSKPMQ